MTKAKNTELTVVKKLQELPEAKLVTDSTIVVKLSTKYVPYMEKLQDYVSQMELLKKEPEITKEVADKAKRIKIDIGKLCSELEEIKKSGKEDYNKVIKYIDGLFKTTEGGLRIVQAEANEMANHFANLEKKRLEQLKADRVATLGAYYDQAHTLPLESMDEPSFQALLEGYKLKKENEEKAAAEAKRLQEEAEKKAKEEQERKDKELAELKKKQEEENKIKEAKNALRKERLEIMASIKAIVTEDVAEMSEEQWNKLLEEKVKEYDEKLEKEKQEKAATEVKINRDKQRLNIINIFGGRIEHSEYLELLEVSDDVFTLKVEEVQKRLKAEDELRAVEQLRVDNLVKMLADSGFIYNEKKTGFIRKLGEVTVTKITFEELVGLSTDGMVAFIKKSEGEYKDAVKKLEESASKKDVLGKWIDSMLIGSPEAFADDELVKEINQKFQGFKTWAYNLIK